MSDLIPYRSEADLPVKHQAIDEILLQIERSRQQTRASSAEELNLELQKIILLITDYAQVFCIESEITKPFETIYCRIKYLRFIKLQIGCCNAVPLKVQFCTIKFETVKYVRWLNIFKIVPNRELIPKGYLENGEEYFTVNTFNAILKLDDASYLKFLKRLYKKLEKHFQKLDTAIRKEAAKIGK